MLRELEALDKSKKSVKYLLELVDLAIEHAMSGEGLFVTKTVHELLWGYKDNLLSDIKKIQDDANKLFKKNFTFVTDDTFGLGVSSVFTIMCMYALCPGGKQCLHHYVCVCMPCVLGVSSVFTIMCVCVCMPCVLGVSSVFTIMCMCMPCVLGVSSVFTIMCVCVYALCPGGKQCLHHYVCVYALCPGGKQCLHHYVYVCMPCVLGVSSVFTIMCVCVCALWGVSSVFTIMCACVCLVSCRN